MVESCHSSVGAPSSARPIMKLATITPSISLLLALALPLMPEIARELGRADLVVGLGDDEPQDPHREQRESEDPDDPPAGDVFRRTGHGRIVSWRASGVLVVDMARESSEDAGTLAGSVAASRACGTGVASPP